MTVRLLPPRLVILPPLGRLTVRRPAIMLSGAGVVKTIRQTW